MILRRHLWFLGDNEPPWAIVGLVARSLKGGPFYKMIAPTDQSESGFTKLSFHLWGGIVRGAEFRTHVILPRPAVGLDR